MYNPLKTKEILERLMAEKNVNQSDIARGTGLSPTAVGGLLRGTLKRGPYPKTVDELAKFFGVTPSIILGVEEKPVTQPATEIDTSVANELDRIAEEVIREGTGPLPSTRSAHVISQALNGSYLFRADRSMNLKTRVRIISIITAERFNKDVEEVYEYLLRVCLRSGDISRGTGPGRK